jgi:acetate kinase
MRVLTVNAGSTSLKLATVIDTEVATRPASLTGAFADDAPDVVAHRVVHGGRRTGAAVVDDAVRDELDALVNLAPIHQPPALAALDECRAHWPHVPNIACFDTAFHASIPEAARTYAIPEPFRETVRQYGFHGLSYAWTSSRIRTLMPNARRVLLAHLGGGQSLCGTMDGASVVTTMGFTPLDGLVMATRCGAIDAGAVTWLTRAAGIDGCEDMLERQSGLLALGGTSDMRELHARGDDGDHAAQLALAVWRHRIVAFAGACIATLGGLDAIVFSGGIGENDPRSRAALVDGLSWLGVAIDHDSNLAGAEEITAARSAVRVFVVAAREELQLAQEAEACLQARR